jgi:hypothetical protein
MRVLIAVVALGLSAAAVAGDRRPGPLNRCTQLLPEGKDYTFKIEGTARHDGSKTTVKHTLTIEGTRTVTLAEGVKELASEESAEAFGREIAAFQQCLGERL